MFVDWVEKHEPRQNFNDQDWLDFRLKLRSHLIEMVRRYRSGCKIQNILGPVGTGKTVLAKTFFNEIAGTSGRKPIQIDGRSG